MKIYNPTGFSSNLTGSFSGSVKGVFDGSFTSTATTEISGAFDSVSSSLSSRVADQESFSSSLDNTFATDADLNIVSASVDALNAATSSYALENSISGSFTSTSQSLASELLKNTTDTLTGDLTVTGTITAQEFHTEFVSASILFDSGSTKFGDTSDDNHDFTGSLKVSSSIYTTSQTFTPQDTTINSTNTSINSTNIIVGNNTSDNVYVGDSTLNVLGGNVGIGTTSPKTSLDIFEDADIWHLMVGGATKKLLVGGQAGSGDVVLQAGAASTVNNAAVTTAYNLCLQRDGGNVGIGQAPSSFTNWRIFEIKGLSNGSLVNFEDSGSTRTGAIAMNDASSLMRFQTFTDADITFEPNNSEVMRVTGDGNVGIGTDSPDEKLDVENGNIRLKSNSDGNTGILRIYDAGGTEAGQIYPVGGDLKIYSPNDVLFTQAGNVGIGTTTPLTDLHINNSDAQILVQGDNKMALHQDAAWNSNILLGCYYDGSNVVYGTANRGAFKIVGLHDSPSQPQTLSIYGADGGASAGATVTFNTVGFSQDEDGNVAIGTTTPRVKLDVRGNASIGSIGTPFNDAYTTSFDSLQVGDGTVVWGRAADSHFSGNYYVKDVSNVAQDTYINSLPAQDLWLDNGSGDLKYRSAASGTAGTQVSLTTRFTIKNSGVVKIGDADDTPFGTQFALAVKGDGNRVAYFDGNSAASVWWGIGNTPQFAIDSTAGGGATFWTHVSGTWKERMRITSLGAIEIAGAGTTVNGNAIITNTNSLATFGSTQSSGVPKDMAFFNGSERMRIQATTGYVGIGTSSPSAMLDIVMPNSGGVTRQDIFRLLQLGQNTLSCYMYGGATDLVQLHVSGTEQNLSLTTGGVATATTATGIHLRSGGNVGIGTTSPFSTAKLQVKTGTDRNVAIQTGTTHTTGVKINAFNDAANTNIPLELNGSLLSLKTGETEKIRILANGNVGIGTTNPSSLLHLYKASGDPMLNIQAVSGGDPGITFTSINNRTGNLFYSDGSTNAKLSYDHADQSFKLYAHNTTVVDFLVNETTAYFPSQAVGIGTTSPVPTLHLVYSNGSYGTDATSGFINQANTGRATQRIRSITDNPAELFFDIDGGIRWDISVRNSGSNYKMNFYPQGATPGYTTVSSPVLQLEQDGDVYMPVGNVGIGVTTTSYKLEVNGGFAATAITETSALKFKENITPLNSQLEIVNKLNPVNFNWKEDGKKDFGFIADEVEEIIPELVSYKDDEVHGLHYSKLTPILVKALQEQQTQIEELKQEIKKLKEI